MSTAEKLFMDALALPENERRAMAERLLDTVLREAPDEVAQAWAAEAMRRACALERGELEALDGDAAIAKLEATLRAIHGGGLTMPSCRKPS